MIDSGVFNYMISLNKSCFTDYSIDLSDPNIIMRIKRNIKVLDIDTITLIISNGDELMLRDVLHALELSYSLLSLDRLMMIDNTILFNDSYCIIENSTGFRIKSKFESFFDITNILFHFRIDFPVAKSNLTNFESIKFNLTNFESAKFNFANFEPAKFNLTNFKSAITENQIAL